MKSIVNLFFSFDFVEKCLFIEKLVILRWYKFFVENNLIIV